MPGVGETLTDRVGPLPVWAWAGLGTITVAGILIYRKKKALAAQAQPNVAGTDQSNLGTVPISNLTVGAEPMPIQMGDTFVDVQGAAPAGPPGPPGPQGPVGKTGPPGPPPKAPPAKTLPPAPKPAPTPISTAKTYTVVKGDTLWGIATKFYGNGALWPQIYNANKAKIGANPNLIYPGQVFSIPAKAA